MSVYYGFLSNLLRMMKEDTMSVCGFFFFFFALLYYYFLGVLYLPFIEMCVNASLAILVPREVGN